MPVPLPSRLHILMALVFYPRGGSAQVVRYLARELTELGHAVHIISGSLKGAEPTSDATTFFRGLPLTEVDYTEAVRGYAAGLDPMSQRFAAPIHPSYEDRPDVPDRVFYKVGPEEMQRLVESWRNALSATLETFRPDIAHLHHLNHLHLAALAAPELRDVPKIAHLHGTELKMLELIASQEEGPNARLWDGRLRDAAAQMQHLITISPDNARRASAVLNAGEERVSVIPNGVDTRLFRPRRWSAEQKRGYLSELLVVSPRGWDESGTIGSVRYEEAQVDDFLDDSGGFKPTLLFVGRFLDFKRLTLLLEAAVRLNGLLSDEQGRPSYNLLIIGGVPGEWEGEHPHTTATRLGLKNVFFAGWLPHEELAEAFSVADLFVAPSYFEPFGQVFLEAMATGLPVVATRSGGPLSFVVDTGAKANGWFSDVDDLDSLTAALAEALSDESERLRRGRNGHELVTASYAWPAIATRFEALYRRLLEVRPA